MPPTGELFEPSREFFKRLPTDPGVYIMRDRQGRVVYVGKANNLRTRVRQYFRPGDDQRYFVAAGLLGRVLESIDTVVVNNEKEALLLENHLIKKHQPRFNVKLRDDKQYLVLRIDTQHDYPRLDVVRNIKQDGAKYFGPYHSATSCRETLRTINRHFQLRTCSDHVLATRKRVCLQYQIKRCPGPCVHEVDKGKYAEQVNDVGLFLSSRDSELVERLRARMTTAAEDENFERAAQVRDSVAAIEKSLSRQNVVQDSNVDQDAIGMWRNVDVVEFSVLFIRGGKLVGRRNFREREQEFSDSRTVEAFVQQYYATGTFIPDEVVVPVAFDNTELIAKWLTESKAKKVVVTAPQRGRKRDLVALANKNAAVAAAARTRRDADQKELLTKLKGRLALRRFPRRIECYDIAHIQGTDTVASMVVFIDGEPDKSLYRRFIIRGIGNDDFASMHQVLKRRFRRAKMGGAWAKPDLIVVDGGKGQLGQALAALGDLGMGTVGEHGLEVIALAKERDLESGTVPDRVFRAQLKDPILLRSGSTEMRVLARIRDEAHRFANTFHRERRRKRSLRSELAEIPGIGPKRQKQLLKHFGSVKEIRAADREALLAVSELPKSSADAVWQHFNKSAK